MTIQPYPKTALPLSSLGTCGRNSENNGANGRLGYPRLRRRNIMLHTYKATLQPDGRLQFADRAVHQDRKPRRVLVTFTDEDSATTGPESEANWQSMVGILAKSPNWSGDPVAIQQGMRDEWH
jgi:hypothetical protein